MFKLTQIPNTMIKRKMKEIIGKVTNLPLSAAKIFPKLVHHLAVLKFTYFSYYYQHLSSVFLMPPFEIVKYLPLRVR